MSLSVEDFIDIINMCANVIIAVFAAFAAFTFFQQRSTNNRIEENRVREELANVRDNANRVNVWLALQQGLTEKNRLLIVRNDSSGPIRNVCIRVLWPSEQTADAGVSGGVTGAGQANDSDCRIMELIPGNRGFWQVLPQGEWKVLRNHADYTWNFPEFVPESDYGIYQPQFLHSKKPTTSHEVQSIWFADTIGNVWRRDCLQGHDTLPQLIKTNRPEWETFIAPDAASLINKDNINAVWMGLKTEELNGPRCGCGIIGSSMRLFHRK